jgi:DNA-binding transcriptional LysR family regulator
MTPTLKQLKVLAAIAEHGSYTLASRALNVSQPALTSAINDLERSLGVPVLVRNAHGAALTEYGELLSRHARTIANVLSQATDEIGCRMRGISGPLRVGATSIALVDLIPEAISRLPYKGFSASIVSAGGDDSLIESLEAGELDVVVSAIGIDPERPGIADEVLFNVPLCIVMTPDHPLAGSKSLSLPQLANEAWLLPSGSGNYRRHIEALFIGADMAVPVDCMSADSMVLLKGIVQRAGYVAILPRNFIAQEEAAGTLCGVPISPAGAVRKVGVRTLKSVVPSMALKLFIDELRSCAAMLAKMEDQRDGVPPLARAARSK